MKFLSVREFRGNASQVWKRLPQEGEMIVTSNGNPVALLTAVNASTIEATLAAWRQAQALRLISEMQVDATTKRKKTLTPREVESEIRRARRSRKSARR